MWSQVVPGHLRWPQMVPGRLSWSQAVLGGPRWLHVVSCAHVCSYWWFQVVQSGPWWSRVEPGGLAKGVQWGQTCQFTLGLIITTNSFPILQFLVGSNVFCNPSGGRWGKLHLLVLPHCLSTALRLAWLTTPISPPSSSSSVMILGLEKY